MLRKILLICALVSFAQLMPAQVATGLYSYGSFDNPGVESIDRGSLNVHFSIPVVNKSGRGLPFQYSLVYDGLVWAPAVASGLTTWTPDSSFGLHGSLLNDGYKGYLAYRTIVESCNRGSTVIAYGGYAYHDQFGAVHAFNYSNGNCEVGNVGDGSSNDGSGYKLNVSPLSVIARNGQTLAVPIYLNSSPQATSGTITDLNGNQIVSSSSGVFTDTLGTSALKITGNGNASSPKVLTYLTYGSNPNNTTPPSANVTITYKTYTVRTSFGCSGVSEYNQSVDLADRITLADGTYYQFGYETTLDTRRTLQGVSLRSRSPRAALSPTNTQVDPMASTVRMVRRQGLRVPSPGKHAPTFGVLSQQPAATPISKMALLPQTIPPLTL